MKQYIKNLCVYIRLKYKIYHRGIFNRFLRTMDPELYKETKKNKFN